MGKKKNKAKQLSAKQLSASQTQSQPQPQPAPQPHTPILNATASARVPVTPQDAAATKPKKRRRRMPKSQSKHLDRIRQVEDAALQPGAQQTQDPSGQTLESARAFFSPKRTRQNTDPLRRTRNNSFVGNALLNVLEEVQQGVQESRLQAQGVVTTTATPAFMTNGSNDELTSEGRISASATAQGKFQSSTEPSSDGFTSQTFPPPSTLPGAPSGGAPHGHNMDNATWNWNQPYTSAYMAHGNGAQASGYQHQALPPNSQSGASGPKAGARGQAPFMPMGQFAFPGPQMQAPPPTSHFAYVNPMWSLPSRGGHPAWNSPHQWRTMEPTQYRELTTGSQTTSLRANASGNGRQPSSSPRPKSPPTSPKRKRPNKPGPLRPKPSLKYSSQSAMMPHRLPAPQHLLIVMDLNGTLLHRPKRANSSKFIQRPFTKPFVSYLLANHTVMVWSSARPENVNLMCNGLFSTDQRKQLVAEWGRDMLGLTQKEYNEKVQVYKQLDKVWQAADTRQWHPLHAHGHRFSQANTLLIDDSVEKAASEPYNLVEVDDFEGKEQQMSRDVLREVAGYLEEAKWQSDVSAWVRSGNRFAYGIRWDREWQEDTGLAPVPAHSDTLSEKDLSDERAQARSQAQSGRVLRSQTQQHRAMRS